MKTHWKKLRNPNYIGSYELADGDGKYNDLTVTIESVLKETVLGADGKSDQCMVAKLKENKPFILNATNAKVIAAMYGDFVEDWSGKKITLTVKRVKAFGAFHDALRVVPSKPAPPVMDENNALFTKILERVKDGTATIEQVEQSYTLSTNAKKMLTDAKV